MNLPPAVRLAAAWSWRLLVIGAVLAVMIALIIELKLLVIPLLIALLISALLVPVVGWLRQHRWPRPLAVAVTFVGMLVIVAALIVLVVWQIRVELPGLQKQTANAYDSLRNWLSGPPLSLTQSQLDDYISQAASAVQANGQLLASGVLSVGSTIGRIAAGTLLALFGALFILIDGRGVWRWIVRLFPRRARAAVDGAGQQGWTTLRNFVRVQIFVAAIDAVGIGLGVFFLGLPLALPVTVLVFLGSFIPVVGAVATGALAIVIALVYNGWVAALIMLGIVLLVQQIEGHVLQPLVMGSAVNVHPLAVVFGVAAGSFLAGIPGALFAVPIMAVINAMVRYIASGRWRDAALD